MAGLLFEAVRCRRVLHCAVLYTRSQSATAVTVNIVPSITGESETMQRERQFTRSVHRPVFLLSKAVRPGDRRARLLAVQPPLQLALVARTYTYWTNRYYQ